MNPQKGEGKIRLQPHTRKCDEKCEETILKDAAKNIIFRSAVLLAWWGCFRGGFAGPRRVDAGFGLRPVPGGVPGRLLGGL